MVCVAWSQGLIFSSCICFNLAGLPGDWASCMYGHWYIAVFTWFLEHCSDTCYWWQHYWLQLRGPCTLSSSSLPSNQSSSAFNKLSSPGDLVALGYFLTNYLESSGSNVDALSLGTFLVIATQLLWHHIRYRTMSSRGILLKLSDFPLLHRNQGTSPNVLWFSQICLDFSTLLTSFSQFLTPKRSKRIWMWFLPFSLPFSLLWSRKKIISYLNFLVSIFSTFPGAIILSLMIYP